MGLTVTSLRSDGYSKVCSAKSERLTYDVEGSLSPLLNSWTSTHVGEREALLGSGVG